MVFENKGNKNLNGKKNGFLNNNNNNRKTDNAFYIIKIILIILLILPIYVFFSITLTAHLGKDVSPTSWVSWYDDPAHGVYVGWETPIETKAEIRLIEIGQTDLIKDLCKFSSDYDFRDGGLNLRLSNNRVFNDYRRERLSELMQEATNVFTEPVSKKIHTANLTGLKPDTYYFYFVVPKEGFTLTSDGSNSINQNIHGSLYDKSGNMLYYAGGMFKTAPESTPLSQITDKSKLTEAYTPFKCAFTSDTQPKAGPGWHTKIASILGSKNYSFVSMIGDFVEDGLHEEWIDYFQRAGLYMDTTPIVPVIGNHDRPRLESNGNLSYYFGDYFPQTEDIIKDTNKHDDFEQFYNSFNWSSVHFQILHFPQIDLDDENEEGWLNPGDYYRAFTTDQLEWIEQDLANSQELPFRITMFHCPITGAGFYGPNRVLMDELAPTLLKYNVTATIHGHAHHLERGTIKGSGTEEGKSLTYFIVGTGGGLADIALRPVPETNICLGSPGYLELSASGDELKFNMFTSENLIIDTCTISSPFHSSDVGTQTGGY